MPESPVAREKRLARLRKRHETHKEEANAKARAWRLANPERSKEIVRDWRSKYGAQWNQLRRGGLKGPFKPEDGADWQERNRQDYLEKKRESTNRKRKDRSLEALRHYGGDPPKCYCCGETEVLLLGLDHINGGGNKHRKETKMSHQAKWAKRNGWPAIFRVACHSCNLGSHLNGGVCPHKTKVA